MLTTMYNCNYCFDDRGDFLFQTYLISFSLIFAFTILVFWPNQHKDKNPFTKYLSKTAFKLLIGIEFGVIGILFGDIALVDMNGVLYNSRIIFVLFSGIIGGPIAMFISSFSMTLGRLLFFPVTDISVVMTINFFIIMLAIIYSATFNRIRFENIHRYLLASILEINIILLFYYNFSFSGLKLIIIFTVFSLITFWAIYWILVQSHVTSQQARQAMALKQIDYLTQLPNNYAIEAKLNNAFAEYAAFSFLHIDIDQFKQLNNKYGYLVGDHILEELSQLIKEYSKGKDTFVGRISGEEFCYVIKDTPPAIALYEAHMIRDLIAQHTFGSKYGQEINVTVSIGISTMPENGITLDNIFSAADAALQATKKTTTNQVYHYNQFLKDIELAHL